MNLTGSAHFRLTNPHKNAQTSLKKMWFEKSRGISVIGFFSILIFSALPVISSAGHALLIAFPDYEVSIDKGIESKLGLGHAGILLISNSGATSYYEFGCYDQRKKGIIRSLPVPNIYNNRQGEVDGNSVLNVLTKLSDQSGQRGRILGAYVADVDFNKMNQFVQKSLIKWPDYHWYSNNCATYAVAVLRAGCSGKAPLFGNAISTPEKMVRDYLLRGAGEVRYDQKNNTFCFRPPGEWWNGLFRPGCQKIGSR